MSLVWAAEGVLAGVPAGAVLRSVVFQLSVPSDAPDRTTCPRCAAPAPRWLLLRCGECGQHFGTLGALELVTALVLGLLFGRFGGQPDMLAFAFLGTMGVALAAIDISVQRLPDRLVLPAYPVMIVLLAIAALVGHDAGALGRALLGGLVLGGIYLALALLRPGGIGGGDVKLAGLAGLALGWLGWPTLMFGALFGFILSGAVSLVLIAARRLTLQSMISLGPFMLAGALLASLAGAG
jgi:leader peptidase (prepilin peptidase) / N-methyltransferase